ncbi:MAG: ATP-dependent zinc metalloprotease FtsH [Candidatus Dojkabacteria bacterium]
MNENPQEPQKNKENSRKDLDQFTDDIAKKIVQLNNKKKGPRIFSFQINPIILIVTTLLILFFLFQFVNRDVATGKINLNTLVAGIKENKYSQLVVQNDGKVQAVGKTYVEVSTDKSQVSLNSNESVKVSSTQNSSFETMDLDSFVGILTNQDLITQIRTFLNRGNGTVSEVVIGDNYLLGLRGFNQKDVLVQGTNEKAFLQKLDDKGIDLSILGINVSKIRFASIDISASSLNDRITNNQISAVYDLDNVVIAKISTDKVQKAFLDWTPVISSFTTLLQQEGIKISDDNFEIVSANIPQGIGLNDVLTILTLVGFVVIAVMLYRSMQGGGGMGIMQFGQSKAKMFFGSKTDTTFKDVAGIDEARDELNEVVDFLKTPSKFRKLGARIPKGILMVGPPGTGKTLLARAIAGEAGVPFFHTSGSEFEEMLVGAGASRVRDLFDKAKKAAPSLIFIDEIDAVARKRGTKIQSGNTEQTLNQILVEMDGFEKNVNVIVLAATNRPDVLDPAILRPGRFDRQIRIELPDMQGRKEILMVHSKNKPLDETVDLEKIAKRTVGFTGADLENIMNESAIIAAKENKKKIAIDDIEEAVTKVILGPAKKSRKRTDNELKLVAYHEAGHAVVAKYTPESTPVDKISITSRGSSGGVTMFLPENDEYIMSKRKLLADITVSLGGRAAEEVALADVSTGASNDIEKATAVARRMIQKFGMSEKLGLVQYGNFEENEYLGYAYSNTKEYSEKTSEEIDVEVRAIVGEAYKRAVQVLTEHRDKLDKVATELLEKEVLNKDEFEVLF